MANQTNKIGAFRSELERIKSQLKRGNLKTGEAQALLRRGRELENAIQDLSITQPSQTPSGELPTSPWGVNTEEDEEEEFIEEEGEELEPEEGSTDQTTDESKTDIAGKIEKNIEENEPGFEQNTESGQKKPSGEPADPNKTESKTPGAAPKPGADETPLPGGAAIDSAKKPAAGTSAENAEGSVENGTKATKKPAAEASENEENGAASGGSFVDRLKQFGARTQTGIKDGINNAKEQAKKLFSREKLKLLWAIPAVRWTIIGIVALALVAGIAFAIFGSLWSTGNSGATGSTYVQAVDPIKDKDWLTKLLQYSGDKEISDAKSSETISVVSKALTDIQADTTLSDASRGKATTALTDLSKYQNSTNAALKSAAATALLADIKSITDEYYACKALYTNTFYHIGPKEELDSLIKKNVLAASVTINKHTYTNPEFPLNVGLCGLLIAMADPNTGITIDRTRTPVMLITFRGGHSENAVNGNSSSHYCGNGVDINGATTPKGAPETVLSAAVKTWLWQNEATLKANKMWPEEMFGGPPYTQQINNHAEAANKQYDKDDHVHIGFGGCKGR